MMRAGGLTSVFAGSLLAALAHSARAQTITKKARVDETVNVRKDDQLMEDAKKKGRATLPQFLALANAPMPGMKSFALKVGVSAKHGKEFVWVRPFVKDGDRFSGRLRNDVESIPRLKYGDVIAFDQKDIIDWMYVEGGKMKGNFTACALLKAGTKADREAFKKEYGLDCDLQ
jgi:uncharacterized protein YegJ (DUF2314 family)